MLSMVIKSRPSYNKEKHLFLERMSATILVPQPVFFLQIITFMIVYTRKRTIIRLPYVISYLAEDIGHNDRGKGNIDANGFC